MKYDALHAVLREAYDAFFWIFWIVVVMVVVALWLPVYVLIAVYEDLAADRRRS
jgi:hypothetical protein